MFVVPFPVSSKNTEKAFQVGFKIVDPDEFNNEDLYIYTINIYLYIYIVYIDPLQHLLILYKLNSGRT
uniref:Uncharacterized protein n=1 Tax=Picea sitchensis TaxID=3332 RepID=A0A1B3TQ83_PICSI|nr:hypothetical protein Q903CP_gene31 [Picea sitchensis]